MRISSRRGSVGGSSARTSGRAIHAASTPAAPLIDREADAFGQKLTDEA